ncbi:3037_t:CDS:2 [Racocetra fulgida]|uniref:3037_t:CDS:1 n=1 Tax=Racocetra fulgida TaxID=60492 RepID=A0A9N8ZNJ3_9GLOM|nr:3037_t:CDS:2 [Racocetra fulgida]
MSEHSQELIKKMCGCCYVNKTTDNFMRPSSIDTLEENAICNQCAEKLKKKQQENPVALKKVKRKTVQNINVTSDELGSSSTNFDIIISNDFNYYYSGAFNNSDTIDPDVFNNSVTIAPDVSNISTDDISNIVSNDLSAIIPDSDSISYNKSEYDVWDNNDSDVMMYDLDEVHEIIANKFEEFEIFNNPVKFIFEVKLDQDLLTKLLLDQDRQRPIEIRKK